MTFWQAWRARATLVRGLRVALVIGTLLIVINQWEILLAGQVPAIWKMLLTYLVPFGVSTYSGAAHKVDAVRQG